MSIISVSVCLSVGLVTKSYPTAGSAYCHKKVKVVNTHVYMKNRI